MTPLGRERWSPEARFPRGDGGDLRERPLGDLFRELMQEAQGLLRDEVQLAKAEVREEARKATKGGTAIGAGGALLYAALLFFGITLVLLGATFFLAWFAALIVTALYAVVGWIALSRGRDELRKLRPSRPIEHVKEGALWAKETMRDVKSSRSANA